MKLIINYKWVNEKLGLLCLNTSKKILKSDIEKIQKEPLYPVHVDDELDGLAFFDIETKSGWIETVFSDGIFVLVNKL